MLCVSRGKIIADVAQKTACYREDTALSSTIVGTRDAFFNISVSLLEDKKTHHGHVDLFFCFEHCALSVEEV